VAAHFDVMRADEKSSSMQSAIHLDLLRDMKLINSLIVAAGLPGARPRRRVAANAARGAELE